MRIIIVSDSHGFGLGDALMRQDGTVDVMTIAVGSSSQNIWKKFREETRRIREFGPHVFFVHLGHNDLVWHERHNQCPKHPLEIFSLVKGYHKRLNEEYPDTRIIISNMFPRTVGPGMSPGRKERYNLMVFEYGQMMKDQLRPAGIEYVLNRGLWFLPSQGREHPMFFREDGLHLSKIGKDFVANGWLKALGAAHH
jgi:lysophospholipase L1-like esterase